MKVFLVGHSHAGSINRAAVAARADPTLARIQSCDFDFLSLKRDPFYGLLRDSRSQITDCGRALRDRLLSADAVVLSLEGNWHNAIGQMERGQRFDLFGEAGESAPLEGRQIIPRSLMRQVFACRMSSAMRATDGTLRSSFVEVLTFVREQARCPCVLLESPPPVPDAKKIAELRSTGAAREYSVTPFAIRTKLWRLQCTLMKQYCDQLHVDHLPVPEEVLGSDGALDPRAYEGIDDPTHMGEWYGRFVVRQLEAWLGRVCAPASGLRREAVS